MTADGEQKITMAEAIEKLKPEELKTFVLLKYPELVNDLKNRNDEIERLNGEIEQLESIIQRQRDYIETAKQRLVAMVFPPLECRVEVV